MKKGIYGLGLCFFLSMPGELGASLYCAVDLSGQRCQFVDLESCKKAVGDRGSCVLNRGEMVAPKGGSPFCLAEQWKTECLYQDRNSCEKVAIPQKATCIPNPNLTRDGSGTDSPLGGQAFGQREGQQQKRQYLPSPGYYPNPGQR